MSSRAAVFASIRRSLAVTGDEATRRFEVETRLKQAPPGIVPKRGQGDVGARLATFKAEAERAQASTVHQLRRSNASLERQVKSLNRPSTIVTDARGLGMVRLGEKSYVVLGMPH